jgi:MEDS: MEthanogen/methylotroph, DcmR Sensory domain
MASELGPQHHAVQFYRSDESLFSTVGGFLAEGLVAEQPCIVIGTEPHCAGILAQLERRTIDVDRARHNGDLMVLDAHEILEMFLLGGMPSAELFEQHIGALIEQARAGRARSIVRAYGEMVDILWKDGRFDAALALELMWNKLALTHRFALLCGYSMGHFYKRSEQMQQVCDQHTHVVPSDSKVLPFKRRRARLR